MSFCSHSKDQGVNLDSMTGTHQEEDQGVGDVLGRTSEASNESEAMILAQGSLRQAECSSTFSLPPWL